MTRKRKTGKPSEPEPAKPARLPGSGLAALLKQPQFTDEHDAYLDELMIGVRHYARDCLERVEDEYLPAKRARMAKAGLNLTLGYTKLLQFKVKRRESLRDDD